MVDRRKLTAALLAAALAAAAPAVVGQEGSGVEGAAKTVNLWQPGDPGQRLYVYGQVLDAGGRPVAGATVHVRQADGNGNYHDDRYRAALTTGADGGYRFGTVLPGQYYSAKHIHVYVTHDAHPSLETEILFKGDPSLDAATDRDVAIFLEEAKVKGETVLHGRFDIVLP